MVREKLSTDRPCTVAGCGAIATIIHREKLMCGKHALQHLEAEAEPTKAMPARPRIGRAKASRAA
jgi:hypothetical protein